MAKTFFFYDLETTGLNPREDRIMQFAGIRTDENLEQIGKPYNILVKLSDDVLPDPQALVVTGITPQETLGKGISEPEFAKFINEEICCEDTVMIGFNNIRFDDEFIRHLLWRNFYDPYEWCWKDGRGRWDLLDVVRMTRALRPDGIKWPVDAEGKPVNKLELITKENGIDHFKAHDALSDVEALIAVTKLIKEKQPKLYDYLLKMRDKNEVKQLVNLENKQPFVYTSGRYGSANAFTTVGFPLTAGNNGNVLIYDLRYDPADVINLSTAQIAQKMNASWDERKKDGFVSIPVKELAYNKVPAVAPLGVLDAAAWDRINLHAETVARHRHALLKNPTFAENVRSANEARPGFAKNPDPEGQLYDGFIAANDKPKVAKVPGLDLDGLADYRPEFTDERLSPLLLHYKARNFPDALSNDEMKAWSAWRDTKLKAALPGFAKALEAAANANADDERKLYVIQELQYYAEGIVPYE